MEEYSPVVWQGGALNIQQGKHGSCKSTEKHGRWSSDILVT